MCTKSITYPRPDRNTSWPRVPSQCSGSAETDTLDYTPISGTIAASHPCASVLRSAAVVNVLFMGLRTARLRTHSRVGGILDELAVALSRCRGSLTFPFTGFIQLH
jgi:hypothetical protein